MREALLARLRGTAPTPSPEPTRRSRPASGAKAKAKAKKPAPKPTSKAAPDARTKPQAKPAMPRNRRPKATGLPPDRAKGKRARPRSRVRKPPPPLLQRPSLGSTLARAAVLGVAVVCMVAFAVALARATLVPSPSSDSLIHTNLRPGASIRAYLDQPDVRDTIRQIGGNVVLGVPFGILLPMLFPQARGRLRVVVLTALTMVMIEAAQGAMVEGRAFDIDDVILNTAGALIGYLILGRRLGSALHPHRSHWWHRYFPPPAGERTRKGP